MRPRGWHNIIKAAYPDSDLKPRHTTAAYLAGAGLNGVIPARGGDVVKLWLLHRRMPESRYPTLAATFLPETLFETAFGIGLVIWALSRGFLPVPTSSGELPHFDVSFIIENPLPALGVIAGAAILGYAAWRLLRKRVMDLTDRLRQGVTILHEPKSFILGVASWQALGRVIRLAGNAASRRHQGRAFAQDEVRQHHELLIAQIAFFEEHRVFAHGLVFIFAVPRVHEVALRRGFDPEVDAVNVVAGVDRGKLLTGSPLHT